VGGSASTDATQQQIGRYLEEQARLSELTTQQNERHDFELSNAKLDVSGLRAQVSDLQSQLREAEASVMMDSALPPPMVAVTTTTTTTSAEEEQLRSEVAQLQDSLGAMQRELNAARAESFTATASLDQQREELQLAQVSLLASSAPRSPSNRSDVMDDLNQSSLSDMHADELMEMQEELDAERFAVSIHSNKVAELSRELAQLRSSSASRAEEHARECGRLSEELLAAHSAAAASDGQAQILRQQLLESSHHQSEEAQPATATGGHGIPAQQPAAAAAALREARWAASSEWLVQQYKATSGEGITQHCSPVKLSRPLTSTAGGGELEVSAPIAAAGTVATAYEGHHALSTGSSEPAESHAALTLQAELAACQVGPAQPSPAQQPPTPRTALCVRARACVCAHAPVGSLCVKPPPSLTCVVAHMAWAGAG